MTAYPVPMTGTRAEREQVAHNLALRAEQWIGATDIDWALDPPVLNFGWTLSANEMALLGSLFTGASTATMPMAGVTTTNTVAGHPDESAHEAMGLSGNTHSHPGGAHTHVWNEVPTGLLDGANGAYTLAGAPNPAASLLLVRNGLVMRAGTGNDFTLSGATITFAQGNLPAAGDTLLASYTT